MEHIRIKIKRKYRNIILLSCYLYCNKISLASEEDIMQYLAYIRMRDRRIPRDVLVDPNSSQWEKLYVKGNNQGMITMIGFTKKALDELVVIASPIFHEYSPHNSGYFITKINNQTKKLGGRPRKITCRTCMALCLAYFRFKGPLYILQGWFGLSGTAINVWFRFGVKVIIAILKIDKCKISMPSDEKILEYIKMINTKHPVLKNVYCVCDGLKIPIQQPKGYYKQGKYYNGWQHGHYITNLFVFAPDGMIIFALLNAPGSVHDSTLSEWGKLYNILNNIHIRTGGKCCMDSAFAAVGNPSVIRSSNDVCNARTVEEALIFKEATSLRQSAEWGMHALQSAFPRITERVRYEESGFRSLILTAMSLLYNFRCDRVGLNQIRTVYAPLLNKDPSKVFFEM